MKKILNNKIFYILMFLIIIIKIFLTSSFLPFIRMGYRFDDLLMLDMAKNMIDFKYLGLYNELTLVKGFMFPLFVSILNFIKIPYLLGLNLLYIFSILLFLNAIKKMFKNKYIILILFVFLLFNPISYSKLTFLIFYRNWFNVCLILIYFSCLINFYYKKNIINSIFLGLSFTLCFFTREDFVWIIPSLIAVLIFTKTNIIKKVIPILTIILLVLTVSSVNYFNYGVFTYNEFATSSFKDVYNKIENVKKETYLEKIKEASKYSESLNKVYNEMLKSNFITNKNFKEGQFMWAFRESVSDLGYYKSYNKVDNFYKKILKELNNSNIELNSNVSFVIVSSPKIEDFIKIPSKALLAVKKIIVYDDLVIDNGYTYGNKKDISSFEAVINQKTLTTNNEYLKYNNIEKITILNYILKIYQNTGFIIFILGTISYIYLIVKKNNVLISTVILLSILIFVLGVVYADISSFNTIKYYYLAPAYIFLNVFFLLNIIQVIEYKNIKIFNLFTKN